MFILVPKPLSFYQEKLNKSRKESVRNGWKVSIASKAKRGTDRTQFCTAVIQFLLFNKFRLFLLLIFTSFFLPPFGKGVGGIGKIPSAFATSPDSGTSAGRPVATSPPTTSTGNGPGNGASGASGASNDLLDAFTPLGRPETSVEQAPKRNRNLPSAPSPTKPQNTPQKSENLFGDALDEDLDDSSRPKKKPAVKSTSQGVVVESNQSPKKGNESGSAGSDAELDRPDDSELDDSGSRNFERSGAKNKSLAPQEDRLSRDTDEGLKRKASQFEEASESGSRDLEEIEAVQRGSWAKRAVKVKWKPIRGARKYLLEISDSDEMERIIVKKSVTKTEAWVPLKPGKYFYRVDGKTSNGRIIETDETFELVVNPQAPDLLEPQDLTTFSKRLTTRGVDFSWQSGFGGSSYVFEVIGESGKIYRKKIKENTFSWLPPTEGVFYWRIGFVTPTGRDWSKYRSFKVLGQAIKKPLKPDPTGTRKSEYSAIVRLGVAVANYTNSSADSGTRANGSSLSNVASAELRWRGGKKRDQTWTFSGSLNFEMIQSKVLGNTFNLPRYYARLFYGKETPEWRYGPLVEVGRKNGAIFLVENETQAKKAEVTRTTYGGGAFGVYRPYETNLGISGLLSIKQETGGSVPKTFFDGYANAKETPLNSTIGLEAGMGLVYVLGPKSLIEGRLRYLKESYSWKGALGGESYSNQTLIIFDFGYGFRF